MGSETKVLTKSRAAESVETPRKPINFVRILMYVILGFGVLVSVLPFFWMVSTSLMTHGEALSGAFVPQTPQFQNYTEAWEQANFARYMCNSTIISVLTIAGLTLFCTPAAYAFARMEFIGRDFLFMLFLSTLMIPEMVTLIPNFLTVTWLGRIGPIEWIDNWPSLTVPFMANAFSIFLLRQFFAQIPDDLWDAARIDGAGHLRFLVQVVLPISRAPLMTVIIFGFIGAWNALSWPMIVTNSETWRPISYGLSKFVTEEGPRFHLQMAGSVIAVIPVLILYFLTQKQFTEGIATTGLKG